MKKAMKALTVICIVSNVFQLYMYASGKFEPTTTTMVLAEVQIIMLWLSELIRER